MTAPTHMTGTAEAWRMWCVRTYGDTPVQTAGRRRLIRLELRARLKWMQSRG